MTVTDCHSESKKVIRGRGVFVPSDRAVNVCTVYVLEVVGDNIFAVADTAEIYEK